MKNCKYCGNVMLSEYESGRNDKSYTAFFNCTKCGAVCDEKVSEYRGRIERKEKWFDPKTKKFEE